LATAIEGPPIEPVAGEVLKAGQSINEGVLVVAKFRVKRCSGDSKPKTCPEC